jgi:HEAT repeat protein
METEIAAMGARTPHELMRCAEVTFIRDCAEMAARSSLTRTESRWGLYHDRADLPERDDAEWMFHLNLRRRGDGAMEFVKRPVAPYLVPVEEFTVPEGAEPQVLGAASAGPVAVAARPAAGTRPASAVGRSPRLLELQRLAETEPDVGAVAAYLSDPDPKVRRAAVATLTEVVPDGVAGALATALGDPHGSVRHAAATALRELVEVLPATEEVRDALSGALDVPDAQVRAAVLDVLRALRLGGADVFAGALGDPDHRVRLQAVRGLVAHDAADGVARAAGDASREVRVAVAHGLGTIGDPASAAVLGRLVEDADDLVRAAAFEALAGVGCPPPLDGAAAAALHDPAWQVRAGAARGLAGADPGAASVPLIKALDDPHLDVRKAAVIALASRPLTAETTEALSAARSDPDADVRAYARRALTP